MPKKAGVIFAWALLGVLLVFLALNRHSRAGRFNYHSEVFSDKAGYQIYLSAFEYGWDARNFPDTALVRLSGLGFETTSEGKIITKYTYGTALAYSPFYLLGRTLESADETYPGFSEIQNRMISLAAAIYLLIGLIFLHRFLRYYYSNKVATWTTLLVLLGTNLLYYGIQETGMSHAYSFALFAGFLVLLKKTNFLKDGNSWHYVLFGILAGWMVVIRQLNIVFPLVYFFLDGDKESVAIRFKRIMHWKHFFPVLFGGMLLVFPQLLYWKYASGHWVMYSYGEEGFNFTKPKFLNVYFNPYNGLFLYTPLVFIMLLGAINMVKRQMSNGWLVLIAFIGLSYLFASWWAWWFGCAFGARSFIEYYVVLALGLGYFLHHLKERKRIARFLIIGVLFLFSAYTFKMTFSISPCYPGDLGWDWSAFPEEVMRPMH